MAMMANPESELRSRSVGEILDLLHLGERRAIDAVQRALPAIEPVVSALVDGWRRGGRLLYVGAGTSGRIGAMDAAECPQAFGLPGDRVLAILAGGPAALTCASETAEDDEKSAMREIDDLGVGPDDVVIGLAIGGTTPFTCAGLERATERDATTVAVTCNPRSRLERAARAPIVLEVGPEVFHGSTYFSAGTAQKLACNSISTAAFARLGRVRDRQMISLRAESAKLQCRAEGILVALGGCTEWEAVETLAAAGRGLPDAVLRPHAGFNRTTARPCRETVGADAHTTLRVARIVERGA
jgi:N-acetylmuramic acid 6-phosphate etherase